jgi:hypothetical protein
LSRSGRRPERDSPDDEGRSAPFALAPNAATAIAFRHIPGIARAVDTYFEDQKQSK